jgi:fatty acid desaturase
MFQASSLSQKLHLKRNENVWISLAALMVPYLAICLVVIGAEKSGHWFFRFMALPLIGALQNHLQILLHEGAHFQLHPKRRWNDLMTDLFCAVPFFGFVRPYRYFHFAHHRHLLDAEKDPEIGFYSEQGYFFQRKGKAALLKMLFLDLCGYHYFQFFFSYNRYLFEEMRAKRMPGMTFRDLFVLVGVASVGLAFISLAHGFYLLLFYWILPQVSFLFLFLKLQGYGEHTQRTSKTEECTLTHRLGPMTRFFIYPLNSDLHLEHHLHPSVPWYRLRRIAHFSDHSFQSRCDSYFFGQRSILRSLLLNSPGSK